MPGAPNVIATPGNAQVVLRWTAPDDGGQPITGYRYRHSIGGTVDALAAWTAVGAAVRTVTVASLANATEYAFEVRAVNGAGGGAAASATATPDGMTPVPALPVAATWLLAGLLALLGVKVRGSRGFGRRPKCPGNPRVASELDDRRPVGAQRQREQQSVAGTFSRSRLLSCRPVGRCDVNRAEEASDGRWRGEEHVLHGGSSLARMVMPS